MSKIVAITKGEESVPCKIGYLQGPEYDTKIVWSIYKYEHRFLWWKWYSYDYNMDVPYIELKYAYQSVSERNTNILLRQYAIQLKHKIDDKILEMKMEDRCKK